uniref:Uncharacterized protein n=1 Tax=Arundo donax TaxID=35708 RepID=A0A0A9H8K4_ARUDO
MTYIYASSTSLPNSELIHSTKARMNEIVNYFSQCLLASAFCDSKPLICQLFMHKQMLPLGTIRNDTKKKGLKISNRFLWTGIHGNYTFSKKNIFGNHRHFGFLILR